MSAEMDAAASEEFARDFTDLLNEATNGSAYITRAPTKTAAKTAHAAAKPIATIRNTFPDVFAKRATALAYGHADEGNTFAKVSACIRDTVEDA